MDIRLNFVERGAGAPLVLLHGNGESHEYFEHQIAYFSKSYRVIAPDTRGHGASPRGEAPFSLAQFADDLCAFMDEMNLPSAHLLGFSDGGNIALLFALKYPERVDKLILCGANLFPRGVKFWLQAPIELGYRIARRGRSPKARKNAETLGLMVNEPRIDPHALEKIKRPTLVIAGTRDMIRPAHTRLIADSLPNSRLRFIPGSHFVARQNPEAFNEAVLEFLQSPNR